MPVNNKLIFVHIPRTAGSSLVSISQKYNILIKGHDIRSPYFTHLKDINKLKLEGYHLFTVIRNPWERVLSAFLHLKKGGINEFDEYDKIRFIEKYDDFKTFIKQEFSKQDILKQLHFIPQLEWICDDQGLIIVDTIIKFQDLPQALGNFMKDRGHQNFFLPRTNDTRHRHYSKYYDQESSVLISKAYQKEIKLFEFKFEGQN